MSTLPFNDLQKLFIIRVPLPRGDATACPEDTNRAPIEASSERSELDFPEITEGVADVVSLHRPLVIHLRAQIAK
jgi:hypothetical protein